MRGVIAYLLVWLVALSLLLLGPKIYPFPNWYLEDILFAQCTYIGGLGGILYCLRGVYLNKCVLKRWDPDWKVWYFLRPIASAISGFVSCIFLKAGLLVLEASAVEGGTTYGYLAIAFVAGYNVDNFMKKIESIAQTVWGIEKSRASSESSNTKDKDSHEG